MTVPRILLKLFYYKKFVCLIRCYRLRYGVHPEKVTEGVGEIVAATIDVIIVFLRGQF